MKPTRLQLLWYGSWKYLSWIFPQFIAYQARKLFLTPIRFPRPSFEKSFYQSAKKRKLQCGIAIYEWGEEKNPLVLLVHGWNGRGTQLGGFVEGLLAKGFKVVAVDGPAHGESEGTQTNIGDYSRFLLKVQAELGSPYAVISHSFGGGCSVLAGSEGFKFSKLVLIGSPHNYDWVVGNFIQSIRLAPSAKDFFLKILALEVGLKSESLKVGTIGNGLTGVQALIVHDKIDKDVAYSEAKLLNAAWSASILYTTDKLGHYRILKSPEVIEKVVDFVSHKVVP